MVVVDLLYTSDTVKYEGQFGNTVGTAFVFKYLFCNDFPFFLILLLFVSVRLVMKSASWKCLLHIDVFSETFQFSLGNFDFYSSLNLCIDTFVKSSPSYPDRQFGAQHLFPIMKSTANERRNYIIHSHVFILIKIFLIYFYFSFLNLLINSYLLYKFHETILILLLNN